MTLLLTKRKQETVVGSTEAPRHDDRPATRRRLIVARTSSSTATAAAAATTTSTTTSASNSSTLRDFHNLLKDDLLREFLEESIWIDPYLIAVTYQYMLRVRSTIQWNLKSFLYALVLAGSRSFCKFELLNVEPN